MTKNNKGRSGGDRPTLKTTDTRDLTASDTLTGWFSLGKRAIKRRSRRKGGAR